MTGLWGMSHWTGIHVGRSPRVHVPSAWQMRVAPPTTCTRGMDWAGGRGSVADLEARLAAVGHLAAVGGAAVLGRGQPVQDLLGPPAVWTRGR